MSLFRTTKSLGAERPSVLIKLRLIDKLGLPIDPSLAWQALLIAFKDHPHLEVSKAEIRPDTDNATSI